MLGKSILSVVIGATLLSAAPASAQYYDPYDRPRPRYDYDRGPPRGWDDDRPRRYGYDRPYRQRFGDACVTSRGTCDVGPSPVGASCRCYIDGFGPKRGVVQ